MKLFSIMAGSITSKISRINLNDTYRIYIQIKPIQIVFILPDANTCQAIQFLPNISHPESRYCPISLDRTQNTLSTIHLRYGKMTKYTRHCPFLINKGQNGSEIQQSVDWRILLKNCKCIGGDKDTI